VSYLDIGMFSTKKKGQKISVDQIQVGLYVHLDLGWMEHPFKFNNFKIKGQEQIDQIKKLGLENVTWEPARSDVEPLPMAATLAATQEEPEKTVAQSDVREYEPGVKQYSRIRNQIEAVEKAFKQTSTATENILKKINTEPGASVRETTELVANMMQAMDEADDLALHMVSTTNSRQSIQSHSLNVAVMSTAFAHFLELPGEQKLAIGIGSMLHDVGLSKLPERFIRNPGPLTKTELQTRKQHCEYGLELVKGMDISENVSNIICLHHEYYDGSGYPNGIKNGQIPYEAQLVGLVNFYERLCSPINMQESVTSHEALSMLYRRHKKRFEPVLLKNFVQFMGIYPPGSIVGLSDEKIGIIIKVFSNAPLRPLIMVYDEDIPKSEAMIFDLREIKKINITKAINPSLLSSSVRDYLSPQERTNFYFDSE
jgi:putative nucleotidyltransferase with HDIG domain